MIQPDKNKIKKKTGPKVKPVGAGELKKNSIVLLKTKMVESMRNSLGIVSNALTKTGVSKSCFYNWMKTDEVFKSEILDIEEYQLDFVEGKLLKLINDENPTAIIFYLKTKGRKRGFVERTEVTGADGKDLNPSITIEIIDSTDKVKIDAGS